MPQTVHISSFWQKSLLLLLIFTGNRALAQNVVFSAAASAGRIGTQDQLQVQYTLENAQNLQNLTPPASLTRDFNVLGGPYSSQSSNIQYVNGRMTQSTAISITYIVQPKHTGNIVIGPASARDAAGHTYQSNAIQVQVVNGSLAARQPQQQRGYDPFGDDPFEAMVQAQRQRMMAMQQQRQQQAQPQAQTPIASQEDINKNLFIRVTVDKNKVHVGEQITATYKLYARLPMNVNISKLPSLNGFWTQDFDLPKTNIKPTEEIVDGKKFQVFTLKKSALFPQQTGNLELDPAEADGIVRIIQQVRQRNPFGDMFGNDPSFQNAFGSLMMSDPFFNDDFFSTVAYKDVKVHLKSTPVKITVTPLPNQDKPADYGNAVGQFNIASKIDKTELSTDDVANLKITITGSGNLKLIEAPKLNLPNGLDTYDPQIIDTITGRSTTISGSKIINYVISPHTAGDYIIPATSFSYYDPRAAKYVTLQTEPYKLHVKQGKGVKNDIVRTSAPGDIHGIDTAPLNNLSFNAKPLLFKAGYWSAYAVPLLMFFGVVAWRRREEELSKDTIALRNRRANKVALKRLATAQKLLQQNQKQPFYEEVSKAIWLYLSDKLNIPLSSLSRERAREAFEARKVPATLQVRVEAVLDECETALYAGSYGKQEMNKTYTEAVDIISKLEEVF